MNPLNPTPGVSSNFALGTWNPRDGGKAFYQKFILGFGYIWNANDQCLTLFIIAKPLKLKASFSHSDPN